MKPSKERMGGGFPSEESRLTQLHNKVTPEGASLAHRHVKASPNLAATHSRHKPCRHTTKGRWPMDHPVYETKTVFTKYSRQN